MTNYAVNVSGLRNEKAKWAELARKARRAGELDLCHRALLERDLLQEEIDLRLKNAEKNAVYHRDYRGTRDRDYGQLRRSPSQRVVDPSVEEDREIRAARRYREAARDGTL